MGHLEFAHPKYLFFLLLLIPLAAYYVLMQRNKYASLQMSSTNAFGHQHSPLEILMHAGAVIRGIAIALLIIALARPQSSKQWENVDTLGIDIVMALDVSSSMLARDFKPDRLEASKNVAIEFISGRPNDRMGLVVFSGETFTQCPLTTDHAVLINLFKDIKSGMIEDGTAIGVGLANATKRLKDSDAISKVVILLTDGVNNQGVIDPITAAELAKTFGIRVYTIGVGTEGEAPYPVQNFFGQTVMRRMKVEIDEETLQQISDITGGKYFRATNNNTLKNIYEQIDQLEKSRISVKEYSRKEEKFLPYVLWAIGLLLLEFLIQKVVLRIVP
ncbi:MAG: VWA domain-containing protein [Bacteroidales bacterium]|nr:VWA domain-containing protein [Bacteroidales bacterium]